MNSWPTYVFDARKALANAEALATLQKYGEALDEAVALDVFALALIGALQAEKQRAVDQLAALLAGAP